MIKRIEQLAKHKHTLLLGLAGLGVCLGLGTTGITSADTSPYYETNYNKPSTTLAKEADLGQILSNHQFQSKSFNELLINQFKEHKDSDIETDADGFISSKHHIRPSTIFKMSLGYVVARKHTPHNKYFEDVANINDDRNTNTITYFETKHNLFLRKILMKNANHKSLRTVKYHLHSIAMSKSRRYKLIFYPTEFSTKHSRIHLIPTKQQHNYPMPIYVKSNVKKNHSHNHAHKLLPRE